jgi:2-dehydro-3-deoxyphosphogluconate aldolase / (4S)-4-hydroxy-2-oxoglutarate aldolase
LIIESGAMSKSEVLQQIKEVGLLPVLRAASVEEAVAIAEAIEAGGIPILEITMTVPGAIELIRDLVRKSGDRLLIGAGTVLDPETARACILAGASFIVSPALNLKTIDICHQFGVVVLPGALTPTEIVTAWEAGADAVKIFPCGALGGASYIKALKAPLPQIEMVPTGGVSLSTAADFLAAGAFALGAGGDLVNASAIAQGKPELITEQAQRYRNVIKEFRSAKATD